MNSQEDNTPAPAGARISHTCLVDLLERFAKADAEHCARIDEVDAAQVAGNLTEDHWKRQFAACDVADGVALEICAYVPMNREEAAAKVRFLQTWWQHTAPEHHEVLALLDSLMSAGKAA